MQKVSGSFLDYSAPSHRAMQPITVETTGYQYVYDQGVVGDSGNHSRLRISWINGIGNTREDSIASATMIHNLVQNNDVHYFHNPTSGLMWDLYNVSCQQRGYPSPKAMALAQFFKQLINDLGGVEAQGRICHFAHSQGALITQIAAQHLSEEEKAMIDVVTFGPARVVSTQDGFGSVRNFASYQDTISYVAMKGTFGHDELEVLTHDQSPYLVDHAFANPVYRDKANEFGRRYVRRHVAQNGSLLERLSQLGRYLKYRVFG